MRTLRIITIICLSTLSLLWVDHVTLGHLMAAGALAFACVPFANGKRSRRNLADLAALIVSSLVMLSYNWILIDLWRSLILALTLRVM